MAVSKLWSVKVRLAQVIDYATNPEKTSVKLYTPEQYQALADVLSYAKDEEKTEKEFYVEGINCNVAIARDEFVHIKEQYQKTDGIQAYHGYLSFKEQNISPELAQKIGMVSGCGNNTSEYETSPLPLCYKLCFLCGWQTIMGRGKSVV